MAIRIDPKSITLCRTERETLASALATYANEQARLAARPSSGNSSKARIERALDNEAKALDLISALLAL